MKKFIAFYLFIFLLISGTVKTQDFWIDLDPGLSEGSGLYVATNGNIIASSGFWSMYYSSDYGVTWEMSSGTEHNGIVDYATNSQGKIFGTCGLNCYAFWKSSSGGMSWTENVGDFAFGDLAINSQDVIFAIGPFQNSIISKSEDNGQSWNQVYEGFTDPSPSVISTNENDDIFIGTYDWGIGGAIYKSVDDGISWEQISGGIFTQSTITSILFGAEGNIYVGTSKQGVYRSVDGGNTWSNIFMTKKYIPIGDMEFNSKGHLFILSSMAVSRSMDKGETWQELSSGLPATTYCILDEIAIDIDDYIYGITNGSGSYRSTSPTTIGIQDNVLQENRLAIVNYPNPFSGSTTIQYSVPEKSFITLKVLNVNGNEIESLVYTQMDKGNFTIDFELGNLPAGIYFYVLSDGTSTASGKMSIVN